MELEIANMYLKQIIVDLFNKGIPVIDKIKEANQPNMVEALEAAMKTVADPSPANIIDDLELAIRLVKQLKQELDGLHPSVINIIKALF